MRVVLAAIARAVLRCASCPGTGSLQRLFDCIGGQYAESNRNAAVKSKVGDVPGAFTRHIVKVRRLTANHRAERNDRIVARVGDELADCKRQLKSTRHAYQLNLTFRGAGTQQNL